MASFSLPSYPPVLPFPDPLLHCGTVPLDLLNDKNKGLRGAKGSGWSQPAELSSLAFQRQLLTSWLSSPDKAHVSSDDLARLDALVGRMVSLAEEAAGLFAHLASRLLPLLPLAAMAGGQQASKVPAIELLPSVARALEATCLAEGQALTIARAREKGVSAATEAGLEAGCAELFSRAALALQAPVSAGGAAAPDSAQGGVPAAAARLSAYLSVSKAWHTGRARMAQLQGAVLAGELGQATALGQAASSSLGDAAKTAAGHGGDPGWLLCVQQLRSQLGTALAAVEKDRLYVTLQVARAGSRNQGGRS
ncbi:predicted protein [Haematococcus lacustris]|uniref:BRO1 domain-containing protein n=1 Tax=Haematococcus lacustris TaxID=44745 RepID=A0A6A0A5D0_HAELA|nr:predicted protein [Haematococcus lacustris]